MMSCRTAKPILGSDPITSLRGAQVGDFEVATGGGIWVATGGNARPIKAALRSWM